MLHAVIMAGGSGTRFWPESRNSRPKQLLKLAGDRTMIQATVDRLAGLVAAERTYVVTNRQLVDQVRAQLPQLSADAVVGEPCKRDTAPCVGLAAELIHARDPDGVMIVLPADHVISPTGTFQAALSAAAELVAADGRRFVTFGIRPTYAAESFGYIERGDAIPAPLPAFKVVRFREKPNAATAEQYLATQQFYWNAGIFVWKAAAVRAALAQFEPEMADRLAQIGGAVGTARFISTLDEQFQAIRGKSVDYAIMEHYDNVIVVEAPFRWDDVGSWQSMARIQGADADGNTVVGKHVGYRSTGCIIKTDDDHLVVTLGMKDCIVVRTPDATLVANKHDEESIRKIVEIIQQRGWTEYL
jgi:mannose-1-phosphate guanylyltransferase